jgi:low affinity Fe/Cu permease
MIEQFLKQLTTVASSPYAFVAYVALVIVWAIVVVKTSSGDFAKP